MILSGVSQRVRNEAGVLGIKDPQLRRKYHLMRAQRRSSHTFPTCHRYPHWYKDESCWASSGDAVFGTLRLCVSWAALGWDCDRSRTLKVEPRNIWDEGFLMMKQPSHRLKFVLQANHETVLYEAWHFSDAPWTSFYYKFFSDDFFT